MNVECKWNGNNYGRIQIGKGMEINKKEIHKLI